MATTVTSAEGPTHHLSPRMCSVRTHMSMSTALSKTQVHSRLEAGDRSCIKSWLVNVRSPPQGVSQD